MHACATARAARVLRYRLDRAAGLAGWCTRVVLENCGYRPRAIHGVRVRSGAIDRVAMLQYPDPRHPAPGDGDIRFLAQFEADRPMRVPCRWLREFVPIGPVAGGAQRPHRRPRGSRSKAIERPWDGLDGRRRRPRARGPRPSELREALPRDRRRRRRADTGRRRHPEHERRAIWCRGREPGSPGARARPSAGGQAAPRRDVQRDAVLAPGARDLPRARDRASCSCPTT